MWRPRSYAGRHRCGEQRRNPPVDHALAANVSQHARDGAEDYGHQTRRPGIHNAPPGHVHKRRKRKEPAKADQTGEKPPSMPRMSKISVQTSCSSALWRGSMAMSGRPVFSPRQRPTGAGSILRTTRRVEHEPHRHDDHNDREAAAQHYLRYAVPEAHPGPRPEHGAQDQGRQARQID